MKQSPVIRLALLALTLCSSALAVSNTGGGGGGGGTRQVCSWVQVPIFVVTGWDRYGFPIGHMELQWRYFCKTVPA